jgi:hypothetical protein
METKSEVFLGQKKSIARYDLEKKRPTWSQTIEGIPGIITTYKDYLFVQGTNKWQTKHIHHMLNANTGELLWKSDEIKSYIVPHYLDNSVFFINIKGKVCKLSLESGKIQFEEKFAGVFARSKFHLFISNNKVYLASKKNTLLVDQQTGALSEMENLAGYTEHHITTACGVGMDQISNMTTASMSHGGGEGAMVAGNGGGGGGDGGG